MPNRILIHTILITLLLLSGGSMLCMGQPGGNEDSLQAQRYLNSKVSSLNHYLKRSERIQDRLLRKLRRQEQKMLRRLQKTDSALYNRYLQNPLSYDSIGKMISDSSLIKKMARRKNSLADSLRRLENFVKSKTASLDQLGSLSQKLPGNLSEKLPGQLNTADIPGTGYLADIQQQLNMQQQVKDLLQQKAGQLENWSGGKSIAGLKNIQKQVYYAGEQIKAWKRLADEPDEAEEKALEYLQGLPGFEQSLAAPGPYSGLSPDATEADLRKAGYQTRKMTEDMLQAKLGNSAQGLQQKMTDQLQQYQQKLAGGKIGELQQKAKTAKEGLQQLKETKEELGSIKKPAFRPNPQRAKPFIQRWSVQYNMQTFRASADGLRPALLELGGGLSYKHNRWLSLAAGIALPIGLGKDWQNLRLSYEGISLRTSLTGDWQYGIALQGGYERVWGPVNRAYVAKETPEVSQQAGDGWAQQAFGAGQQVAYIGVKKAYKINSQWKGSIMLGYNFLAGQGYNRSPFMLRFGWEK